jgi:hypothetical protein
MKTFVVIALVILLGASIVLAGTRILNASTEASGNQHNQSTAVGGAATITCTLAAGQNATCFIVGPGVGQQVPQGQNVGTSGAGTVTLSCNGTAPLRCQARVDGPVKGKIEKQVVKPEKKQ